MQNAFTVRYDVNIPDIKFSPMSGASAKYEIYNQSLKNIQAVIKQVQKELGIPNSE